MLELMTANQILDAHHYLGRSKRAMFTYHDEYGVMVFAGPASRRLPVDWLELVRWCIVSTEKNAGSKQFRACREWLASKRHVVNPSTIVSYSDPSAGHTGALYRACNWLWAPTWHRLRTPPSGNGSWREDKVEAVKDRWVFPLLPDARRVDVLRLNDESLRKRMPWAEYREPKWKRGRVLLATGGGDYARWIKARVNRY